MKIFQFEGQNLMHKQLWNFCYTARACLYSKKVSSCWPRTSCFSNVARFDIGMNWYDVCLQCCDTLATCRLDYRGKIEISQNSGDVSGLTSFC